MMAAEIDWSKAGQRLRHQPRDNSGRNPDFNWVARRWKDEADYYADEIGKPEIIALAGCPTCGAAPDVPCLGLPESIPFHMPRRRAAGEELLRLHGPRFGGELSNGKR
jgi:hypothetical protein